MNKKIVFVSILAVLLMVSMSFVSTLDAAYVKQKSITLNKQEANYDDLEQIPSGYGLLTRVTATGVGPWPNFGGAGKPKVGCTVLYPHVELDTGYFLLDGSKLEAPVTIEMAYFIGYWTLSPTNSECRIYMKGFGFGVQIRGMQQENNPENTQETPQDITPNPTETNTPANNNNEQTEEYNINPTPTPTYPEYNPTPEPEPEEKPERESTNDFIEDEVVQQPEATPPRINSGKIEVYVLSSKGGPISGATVRVSAGYRYLPKTKTTGFNGIAVFDNLPIGVIPIGYSVTAYKPGYIVVNGGKWWNPKLSSYNPEAHVTITLTPTETNTPTNNNNEQTEEYNINPTPTPTYPEYNPTPERDITPTPTETNTPTDNNIKQETISIEKPSTNNPNNPPSLPGLTGHCNVKRGKSYSYGVSSYDIDGDDVYYRIDWGDGSTTGWMGPFNSGYYHKASHSWSNTGRYTVCATAKDIHGCESIHSMCMYVDVVLFREDETSTESVQKDIPSSDPTGSTNTPTNNNNEQTEETAQNQAPSVLINGPSSGTTGQTLSFSSSASDPDGSITRYDWYYKGSWHDNLGSSISISFPTTGTKTVKVKVYDNDGATNIATRSVSITSSGSSSSSSSSPSSSSGSPSSSSGGGTAL